MNKEFYEQYYKKGGSYEIPMKVFEDLLYEYNQLQQGYKELTRLVADKVMLDYNYDSVFKDELIEERLKNIRLEESKNMLEQENKNLKEIEESHHQLNGELMEENKCFKKGIKKLSSRRNKYKNKYYKTKHILDEFKKWLEEEIENNRSCIDNTDDKDSRKFLLTIRISYLYCLDKLEELKESDK